jgi:hypothetical protein
MSEKPASRPGSTTDNRGWFRRALALLASSGIVVGVFVLR